MADIPIDAIPRRVQFTGNTGLGPFAFTFNILAAADIAVYKNATLLTITTDYTVSLNANGTGSVTLTGAGSGTALVAADYLTIIGDLPLARTTDFTTAGDLLASALNDQLDASVVMTQQISERVDRALRQDPNDVDGDMTIPEKSARLGKYLKFNDTTGNPEVGSIAGAFTAAGMNHYNFTGDGATVNFTLGMEPGGENNTQAYIDGVYQQKDGYNVSGAVLQFSVAPPNLSTIEVMVIEVLPVGATTASQVSFTQAGSTYARNVQLKLQESISVTDFGADPTGTTDSYTAIVAAIAALPSSGGTLIFPHGTYLTNTDNLNGLSFTGKNNFVIEGRESTIKVVDGGAVTANREVMYFNTCSDGVIRNLIVDGNRANRTPIPGETSTFNVNISYSNSRLLFDNVRSINSTSDGFYLTSSASGAGTLSTYPTDITLRNCSADNSWRNGISAIASNRLVIEGGRYSNSKGGGPEDGIDIEPDAPFTHGNKEVNIINVDLSGNNGWGLAMAGTAASTPNVNPVVSGLYGTENRLGFLLIANANNGTFSDIAVGPHSETSRGVIDIQPGSADISIDNVTFDRITATGGSVYCIYQASGYNGVLSITNVTATSISCSALFLADISVIDNMIINTCTDTKECVSIQGAGTVIRNFTGISITGNPIGVNANDVELDGITIRDYGASASAGIVYGATALRGIVRNASVFQSTAIPGGTFGIRYDTNPPRELSNFSARSAGTDYTSVNVVGLVNGATLEGTLLSAITPNIGSLPWTPVMKDGATTIATTLGYATYVRSGDIIHARCGITRNDATSLTGQLNITGLPYAGSGAYAACGTAWFDGNVAADFTAVVNLDASGVGQFLQTQTSVIGSIIIPTNLWENTRGLYFSLTYDAVTT